LLKSKVLIRRSQSVLTARRGWWCKIFLSSCWGRKIATHQS